MPITRKYLDWKSPALPAAAEYLLARYRQGDEVDLSRVLVVTPVIRAGRRLLELLVQRASEQSLLFTPPEILTEGKLPERLYTPKRQFADDLTHHLAWSRALLKLDPARLAHLAPHPPADDDALGWLDLAEMLARVHRELSADGLDFGHVASRGRELPGFVEEDRWRVLAEIQTAYLRQLDELELWDLQTARLFAIEHHELQTACDVVLLGMVDANVSLRKMLDQVADRVTVLVHAPAELADHFDEHGCLLAERWTEREIAIDDAQVCRVDGPAEQADAAARFLSELGGKYRTDEVVVGLADAKLAPQLQRELAQLGIEARSVEGRRLAETGPYRLIRILAEYAQRRRFVDLAAAARHPDIYDWLREQPDAPPRKVHDLLTSLDEYYGQSLPAQLDGDRLQKEIEFLREAELPRQVQRRQQCEDLLWLLNKLDALCEPLAGPPQALAPWCQGLRGVLSAVYGQRRLNRHVPADHTLLAALQQIIESLNDLEQTPPALAGAVRRQEAMEMLLRPLGGETIPPLARPQAVDLLGWLELALDDAPALVVTSFNDGFVPKNVLADTFLPNHLRRELGLLHNERRYARDAYVLSVLAASRERLQLIVGHRDPEGNPLVPSRLLFATSANRAARRALAYFSALPAARVRRNLFAGDAPPRERSAIEIPLPSAGVPIPTALSVSQFKAYIACPYRFYLAHLLRLSALVDDAAELDGGAFGDLIHDCLQHFGRETDVREQVDPAPIFAYLSDRLDKLAGARYGNRTCRPAIRVQVEQARLRFKTFADWQAERTKSGWLIAYSEDFDQQLSAEIDVDGEPFTLRGRIDRIDYHRDTRQICVLDYKTGDAGKEPDKTHRRRDEWVDLQLPLYRHLLKTVAFDVPFDRAAEPLLGYINLPKDVKSIRERLASWTPDELASADAAAWEIVRNIRARHFWPRNEAPEYDDDFMYLCQDNVLEPWSPSEEGGAR
jgi:RecB family exonuclease